jgi:hypothetical protein
LAAEVAKAEQYLAEARKLTAEPEAALASFLRALVSSNEFLFVE